MLWGGSRVLPNPAASAKIAACFEGQRRGNANAERVSKLMFRRAISQSSYYCYNISLHEVGILPREF